MNLKRAIFLSLGVVFIILGIFGLFLPILQGILFLLIGLYFLSKGSVTAHRYFEKIKAKFPREVEYLRGWKRRLLSLVNDGRGGSE